MTQNKKILSPDKVIWLDRHSTGWEASTWDSNNHKFVRAIHWNSIEAASKIARELGFPLTNYKLMRGKYSTEENY